MPKNSLIGKRFHSVIADCSCLFEVKAKQGRGGYRCVVVNVPIEIDGKKYDGEFAGEVRLFTTAQIEDAIANEEYYAKMRADHAAFYAGLEVGAIVHYHYGFGQFVRCEVVALTEPTRIGLTEEYPAGTKVLRMKALVGPWRERELRASELYPRWVSEGNLMCPNLTNVYESPRYSTKPGELDPRTAPECVITGVRSVFA